MRGSKRRAGAGAAGLCNAYAPFPYPHAQATGRNHRCEFHVRTRRKQLVMLDLRAQLRERNLVGTVGENHAMRIAHGNGRGNPVLTARAHGKRVRRQFAGQWNVTPAEFRLSHVHSDHSGPAVATGERTAARLDAHAVLALFRHKELCHAARRVAAGFDLVAVGVENPHEDIGAALRPLDHDHLVATDAVPAVGDQARKRFIERDAALARVENNEIVAQPVHLVEGRHGNAYRVRTPAAHPGCPRFDFQPVEA